MAEMMASRSTRVIRGKEEVNGFRKPKEWSSKFIGTIKGKEKVNRPAKPRKWITKFIGLA